jgi:Glycosyltransferase 61
MKNPVPFRNSYEQSFQEEFVSGRTSRMVNEAVLFPPPMKGRFGRLLPAGVLDAEGRVVAEATLGTERRSNAFFQPSPRESSGEFRRFRGTWLFGGMLSHHFGHQITRSMGRLHALAETSDLAGIMFLPLDRRALAEGNSELFKRTLAGLGVSVPLRVQTRAARVERLIVPPDLFSEANDCIADAAFITWAREQLAHTVGRPAMTRRLYITRTGMGPHAGRVLCEDLLEENFRKAGYEIFRPELVSPAEQLQAYLQSKVIVMTDGSAGHLAAFARRSGQTIAVIARRREVPKYMISHLQSFGLGLNDSRFSYIDRIVAEWKRPVRANNASLGELDFDGLRADLIKLRIIDADAAWKSPDARKLQASKLAGLLPGETITAVNGAAVKG